MIVVKVQRLVLSNNPRGKNHTEKRSGDRGVFHHNHLTFLRVIFFYEVM